MNPSETEGGPLAESRPQEAATTPPVDRHLTPADPHDVYMFGLDWRIRWLERHRHWFLRTPEGRAQREFLDRRDVA